MTLLIILILSIFIITYACLYFEKYPIYNRYIEDKTIFYFKTKPEIKSNIVYINWDDNFNPRMELKVIYPSGTTVKLNTTIADFNRLWEKI